jgi:predicted Zn-ribbon and HTH transcriptional regulator
MAKLKRTKGVASPLMEAALDIIQVADDADAAGEPRGKILRYVLTCPGLRTRVSGKGKKTMIRQETCGKKAAFHMEVGKLRKHVRCPFCSSEIETRPALKAKTLIQEDLGATA